MFDSELTRVHHYPTVSTGARAKRMAAKGSGNLRAM